MKTISLTQGMETAVDDQDYDSLSQFKWRYQKREGKPGYACRTIQLNGKVGAVMMHRQILGNPAGLVIDHKDGNGLNNQRLNLRPCTHAQNMANRSLHKNNTTGVSGVHRHKNGFMVKFKKDNRWFYFGVFKDLGEAIAVRNNARPTVHGEFGN